MAVALKKIGEGLYLDLPVPGTIHPENILNLTPKELYEINPIVTYNENGKPLNRFRDMQWDHTAYKDMNTNRVLAKYKTGFRALNISQELMSELKAAVLHYFTHNYLLNNNARSAQIMYEALFKFYLELDRMGLSSITALQQNIVLRELLSNIGTRYAEGTLQAGLFKLDKLAKLNVPGIQFTLPVENGRMLGAKVENTLTGLAKEYSREGTEEQEQTLYIPQNVHSKLINHAFDLLTEGEKKMDQICQYFTDYWKVHELSESIALNESKNKFKTPKQLSSRANTIRRKPNDIHRNLGIVTRKELLKKYELEFTDSLAGTGKGIFYYTGLIAAACYVLIASFSGMREDEVLALKDNSFKKKGTGKRQIFFFRSYESKISGGEFVDYVTSTLAGRAFNLLRKLHKPAKALIPELKGEEFLCLTHRTMRVPTYGVSCLAELLPKFVKHFDISVTAKDIEEHELFNPRNSLELKIGQLWPISTHQFRRTLIVNFLTHGVAGITQVRQQVKHMYASMTDYYGKNAYLAMALKLSRSEDFISALDSEQVDVSVLIYKRFYQSDEKLAGGKGNEIVGARGAAQQLSDEEIKILIEKGIFKITRTPFGFCTKGDLCDKTHIVDPTICGAKCDTMIITKDNAQNWKKLYLRNQRLMKSQILEDFEGTYSMMLAQNNVALTIMKTFNISH